MKGLIIILFLTLTGCYEEIQIQPEQDSCTQYLGSGEVREAPQTAFLFAGQSNMVGLGKASDLSEEQRASLANVVYWTGSQWETYKPAENFGPDLFFLIAWSQNHPTETVGAIKCAVGATSMTDWSPDQWLYQLAIKTYRNAGSPPVIAVLWDQGESDADGRNDNYQVYPQMLETLITAFRRDTGFAPFLIGETQYPAARYIQTIQDGQKYVATIWHTQSVRLVDTTGFTLGSDALHFSTAGQVSLGNAFYSQYSAVTN